MIYCKDCQIIDVYEQHGCIHKTHNYKRVGYHSYPAPGQINKFLQEGAIIALTKLAASELLELESLLNQVY